MRGASSSISSRTIFRSISPPSTRPRGSACTSGCHLWHVLPCRFSSCSCLTAILHVVAVHLYTRRIREPHCESPFPHTPGAVLSLSWLPPGRRVPRAFRKARMPGELVQGHAKLEKDCANCHKLFTKGAQTRLCVACHKDIGRDREQGRGLHGKKPDVPRPIATAAIPTIRAGAPTSCSSTRKPSTTPHEFSARRRPQGACLRSCHKPNVKFRNAPGQCIGCHKSTDKHKGRLGENCQTCHSEESWSKVRTFDHSKTKFPLTGGHEKVTCEACHPNEKYKGVPLACSSCHQLQDVHQGKYGAKCKSATRAPSGRPFTSITRREIPAARCACNPEMRSLPHRRSLQR